jgi:hypothetical protein
MLDKFLTGANVKVNGEIVGSRHILRTPISFQNLLPMQPVKFYFNNISVISRWSVLLVEETKVPRENHWQTWSYNVVSSTPGHEQDSNSQH